MEIEVKKIYAAQYAEYQYQSDVHDRIIELSDTESVDMDFAEVMLEASGQEARVFITRAFGNPVIELQDKTREVEIALGDEFAINKKTPELIFRQFSQDDFGIRLRLVAEELSIGAELMPPRPSLTAAAALQIPRE